MSTASAKSIPLAGVLATLVAAVAILGCGGSGTARPGTGGANGAAGGSTGSGGLAATGGSVGAGGSGNTTELACSPGVNPTTALLTDFTSGTNWSAVSGKWGVAGNLQGSLYAYAGSKSGTWEATVESTGDLAIGVQAGSAVGGGTVASGDYAGGGMAFSDCVNTNTWTGVSFTLGGSSGGCDVYFQVQTFDEQGTANHGGCTGTSCYVFPQAKVTTGTAPITVHFSDLSGGMPVGASAIAKQIVGLQWQLQSPAPPAADAGQPACPGAELLVDNVQFVSN